MADDRERDEPTTDDARLIADLGRALGPDPVPDGFFERAEGLLPWLTVDADLAAMVSETEEELVGTRGVAQVADELRFQIEDGTVVLEVVVSEAQLEGRLLTGDGLSIRLLRADGSRRTTDIDELGHFLFENVDPGPYRLTVEGNNVVTITTEWFVL